MDSNFLSGGVEELQQAKAAVIEAEKMQDVLCAAAADTSGKEKDLESQKKYVEDKINSAIKERRGELKKTHDEQVDQASKRLKEAEKKRKAAKSDAVQARISSETSDSVGRIAELKKEAKTILKENKVPGFCNTTFYYALYAPKRGVDFVIFLLTVIIAFGAIPNVVCLLLKTDQLIIKILVYLAIVVFFVGIYFLAFAISKRNKNGDALEQVREKRNEIRACKKDVKKTSKAIVKDEDESTYGLEEYDSEIAQLQQIYNETTSQRDAALKEFDETTAAQIRTEIQTENQSALDQMAADLDASRKALETAQQEAEASTQTVSGSYEVYLGKRNTTAEKIDGLIALIQEGKASTIMEALDIQNGEIK